jgi:hypothetical protein
MAKKVSMSALPWNIIDVSNVIYQPSTARERDVDTLQFFPKKIPFPSISTEVYLKQAASDILAILQKPPSSLPYLSYGDPTNNSIVQIATLLGQAVAAPPSPQFPIQTPRVPIEVHPLRVHIPLLLITSTSEGTVADGTDFQTLTFETPAITSEGLSTTTPISLTAAPWLMLHRSTSTITPTHERHPNLSSPCQPYLQRLGNDGPTWTNA